MTTPLPGAHLVVLPRHRRRDADHEAATPIYAALMAEWIAAGRAVPHQPDRPPLQWLLPPRTPTAD